MAFPIVGTKGNVTCAVAGYLGTLFGTSNTTGTMRIQSFGFNINGPESDVTGFLSAGTTSRANISGLRDATVEVSGFYPKTTTAAAATTPRIGNSGFITCASASVDYVPAYSLEFEFGEVDITSFDGTAIGWRRFMPSGTLLVRGSYTTRHASGTTLNIPFTPNTGGAAATFKLTEDGTNDVTYTGNIIVPRGPRFTVNAQGGAVESTYDFVGDGDFTPHAGDTLPALFGTSGSVLPTPEWDTTSADGVPDVQCVFTAYTSRTYTANCFLKNIRLDVRIGEPIKVTASLRVSDGIS